MRPEHWLYTIPLRLRSLFRWAQADQELEDELRDHLERKTDEYIAQGMAPEEAHRRARLDLGGIEQTKEKCRDARHVNWTQDLAQDLRFGLRMLRKSPGFTCVAVLILALGIGANTAIFSLINAIMLRSLPVHAPEQLVFLKWSARRSPHTHLYYSWAGCPGDTVFSSTGAGSCSFSYPVYEQIRENKNVFSDAFAFVPASGLSDITVNGQTAQARGDLVSGNIFSTLGVGAAAGRTLVPLDDVTGAAPVVVFSYAYWQSRFGSDSAIVGKTILLNGLPFTVAGVVAPGFAGLDIGVPRQFWVPLSSRYQFDQRFPKEKETDGGSLWVQMGARLKPGASISEAEAALNTIFLRSVTSGPAALFKLEDEPHIELPSATRGLPTLRQNFSKPLFVLMSAVCMILLIACTNVAGLMLARSVARQKEISVRVALGAERWRIVRQLLTESLMLAAAGGALGILFAYWGASSLSGFFSANGNGAFAINVSPDLRILAFALAISCLVGLLSGLAPALRGTRFDLIPALKESDTGVSCSPATSGRRLSVGSGLVVAQVALSILLLSAAGLLVRTLVNLETMKGGFDARNVLLFDMDATLSDYKGPKLQRLYRDLQRQFAALPGVTSASYSMTPLLSGARSSTGLQIPDAADKSAVNVDELPVGPDFFETMRIPFLTGRAFTPAEFESSAQPQPIVVNQTFTRRFFGNGNPLGRAVSEPDHHGETPQYKIVGVVGDAKYDSLRRDVAPTAYLPIGYAGGSFEIRTAMKPKVLIPAAREVLNKTDKNLFLLNAKTQVEQIDESLFQERLLASLSSLFAVLALTLACIGLYGLLSYEVTRRTHEIGVRVALGAHHRDVLRLVVAKGAGLVAAGSVAGMATAFGVTRYVESFLYGVKPIDPWTFAGVVILLFAVALAACYIPAQRAMRVDPMVALRYE